MCLLLLLVACSKDEKVLTPLEQKSNALTANTWQLVGLYNNNQDVTDFYPNAVIPKMELKFQPNYTIMQTVATELFMPLSNWRLANEQTLVLSSFNPQKEIVYSISSLTSTELKLTFGYMFAGDIALEIYELRFKKK
ncbi:MAG: hypothetical protein ACOVQA_08150 [Thermoflexibacteraceae bacterium]